MKNILLVLFLVVMVGCGSSATPMPASSVVKGKLETSSGKPIGNVLLTLQPLGEGHPAPLQVSEDGTFQGEIVPGKYAYFVAKSSAKNSEQALKSIDAKYYEASMARTVSVQAGQELRIAMD
jgi:hypothetical protein